MDTSDTDFHEAKAVIAGLSARLPQSRNVQEFWENLAAGKDLIGPTRWPQGLYSLPPRIGAIHDADKFDSIFFNISDSEANQMNPMLRHLLEVTYECVIDSGLPLPTLQAEKTGLYLACFGSDSDFIETSKCRNKDHVSVSPYLAGEIMRFLGLKGPAITVDTACSSSLAALNMAVHDVQAGRCNYAIVASCNLTLNPLFTQQMFVLDMLSKDGESRVFDAGANGYVRAEGFAALLIASQADECSRVYTNIVDIGVNCDGFKEEGVTNPSSVSQANLMKELYERAHIDVRHVKYVEAHGTGTQVGDAAEVASIAMVFCPPDRPEPLSIGSVKSNMGHSEATAGLAAMIKVILAMHYREIPANLRFSVPNPAITALREGKVKVVDKPTELNSRYVGVNSFGFGGVNGHVILEPFVNKQSEDFVQVPGHVVIPLTVRNAESVQAVQEFVNNNRYNGSLLGLLSKSMLSCDKNQPIRGYIQIGPKEDEFAVHSGPLDERPAALCLCLEDYMFCQVTIARDLLEIDAFTRTVRTCSDCISLLDPEVDMLSVLTNSTPLSPDTRLGMLAATTVTIGLIECLQAAGLEFSGVIGCGMTEIIAAYLDGAISLNQCFLVTDCIARHLDAFSRDNGGRWNMYDVRMNADEAYQLGPWVQVLGIHARDHVTICVEATHSDTVMDGIHAKGGYYNVLPTNLPVYSGFLSGLCDAIKTELWHIIPAPRYSSCHMQSCQGGWSHAHCRSQTLCDAAYFSRIICKPVNLHTAIAHNPDDSQILNLFPTASPVHLCDIQASFSLDNSKRRESRSQSICSENVGVVRLEMRYASVSTQSCVEDSTYFEGEYCLVKTFENVQCLPTAVSFCHTLGEMHMKGYTVDVGMLLATTCGPLGIEAPCLSPLVKWNHTVSWNIPHWLEFSCRVKDEKLTYSLEGEDLEGIQSPLATLLYHSCMAIADKLAEIQGSSDEDIPPIKLYDLVNLEDSLLTNVMLADTIIEVHNGTKIFVASVKDQVLLRGRFEVAESLHLPRVPGYDLDINDNVQHSPKDGESVYEKAEIQWEDSWLQFIVDLLEFANQHLDTRLRQLTIEPRYHRKEAKDCPTFLAVVEKHTGVCRSGGCVLQFRLPTLPSAPDVPWKQIPFDNPTTTQVSKVMVYSLYNNENRAGDKVILYLAEKMFDGVATSVLGFITFHGEPFAKEIPLPGEWKLQDVETFVPYTVACHLLYDLAEAREEHTILVLPPLDTASIYVLSLACQLGCSVFTSTWDVENRQCLEQMFPHVRVLDGGRLNENILLLTQGRGVDVVIRLAGGDVAGAMEHVGDGGRLIQCIAPGPEQQVPLGIFNNNCLSIVNAVEAFRSLAHKSTDDIQALMFNMMGEAVGKLAMEGFPEASGILYTQENSSSFMVPLSLDKLLSLIMEPSLGLVMDDLTEADGLAIETIQNLIAPKPKDYSIVDTSYLIRNPLQGVHDPSLNTGMLMTPPAVAMKDFSVFSPEVNIISLSVCFPPQEQLTLSPVDSSLAIKKQFPPTSTPMMDSEDGADKKKVDGDKCLEESYLEPAGDSAAVTQPGTGTGHKTDTVVADDKLVQGAQQHSNTAEEAADKQTPLPKGLRGRRVRTPEVTFDLKPPSIILTLTDGLKRRSSACGLKRPPTPFVTEKTFENLMTSKAKHIPTQLTLLKPKIDLLMVTAPMTPMTPALKQLLTPSHLVPNLVPLNAVSGKGRPLYIVHPVTGQTLLLEKLGAGLQVPCYGIQRNAATPSNCISSVASYYRNSIERGQSEGPYRIAGYSLGSIIALEIALQLQAENKQVETLILFDGSPGYINSMISPVIQRLPADVSQEKLHRAVETGALINWMSFYGPVHNRDLTFGLLSKLPNLQDMIETAVDLTMGNAIMSPNQKQTKWLTAKQKIIKGMEKPGKDGVYTAARELIRLKRREKAEVFVIHSLMAFTYKANDKFQGDIHLHRVKSDPIFEAASLGVDYDLQSQCTGQVHVRFYSGDHETFITTHGVNDLQKAIHELLRVK